MDRYKLVYSKDRELEMSGQKKVNEGGKTRPVDLLG